VLAVPKSIDKSLEKRPRIRLNMITPERTENPTTLSIMRAVEQDIKYDICITQHGAYTMSLTASDVKKIAHLARLGIDEQQIEHYAQDLSKLLDLMTQMGQQDTNGVSPMAHPLDQMQRLRPDAVTESDQRDAFQAIAPQTEAGLYLVPKVID
jgi:aspartyl-tRNA(Asn)/glutamyl-tRNA(Gln) amidotransferase subunit C